MKIFVMVDGEGYPPGFVSAEGFGVEHNVPEGDDEFLPHQEDMADASEFKMFFDDESVTVHLLWCPSCNCVLVSAQ